MRPLVSVIVTVLDEERHLPDLLDSLAVQEPPYEVLVIDAGSQDKTQSVVRAFAQRYPNFRLIVHPGSRGESRNHGALQAHGEYLAFVDGDCIVNAFWLQRLRDAAGPRSIVAGHTIQMGYWAFERLERVELAHRGHDVSFPSCNLFYPREAFLDIDGFDPRFVTAEDIDLNYRAVEAGLHVVHAQAAIVYHRARDSITGFLSQAFWNGYGRKQLTLKHGELWRQYSFRKMIQRQLNLWGLLRMMSAVLGYAVCRLKETHRDWGLKPLVAPAEARA